MKKLPAQFTLSLIVVSLWAFMSCPFCWAAAYNAFAQQTAVDSAFYQDTSQAISNTGQDTTTVSVTSTGAESSGDKSTTSTTTTSSSVYGLLDDFLSSAGKGLISVGTTSRTAYLYDMVNEKSSSAVEWSLAKYYPGKQDTICIDAGAGLLVSDKMRGEASLYAQCEKKAKLILLDIQSLGIGVHVQHGLHGKLGAGLSANASTEKILGIEVSTILETVCFWIKERGETNDTTTE